MFLTRERTKRDPSPCCAWSRGLYRCDCCDCWLCKCWRDERCEQLWTGQTV